MVSKRELMRDCQRMGAQIVDLERRLKQVYEIAAHGEPETRKWRKYLVPGFLAKLRLKHIIGHTEQFANLAKLNGVQARPEDQGPRILTPPRDLVAPSKDIIVP